MKKARKKQNKHSLEQPSRERLVDIAEDLFVKKGYERTSINDILREGRISKGGFYHYFISKNEIFAAVIDRHLHVIREEVAAVVANKKLTAVGKLKLFFNKLVALDHSHNYLFSVTFVSADTRLVSQEYFDHSRKLILPLLSKIIDQGVKEGLFKSRYPHETLELLMLMKQSSIKFLSELFKNKKKLYRYVGAIDEITERALGLKKGFFNNLKTKNQKVKNKSLINKFL